MAVAAAAAVIHNHNAESGEKKGHHHGYGFNRRAESSVEDVQALYKPLRPETSIERMQRVIRTKVTNRIKLQRANLGERLRFETDVVIGTIRLINQLMVFMLFIGALMMSSDEPIKRGIYEDLRASFDFAALEEIQSRDDFLRVGMPSIAKNSKQYFLLSSQYFNSGEDGTVQLVGDMQVFSRPQLAPQLSLKVKEYSLTAWVKTDATFVGGYIMRKRPVAAGDGSSLACWSWYLHRSFGPQLHYGAHDYYEHGSSGRQYEVGLSPAVPFAADTFAMLTMTISEHNVSFYHNLDLIGVQQLPRPQMTDCNNNNEGVLVGDTGMELGNVRYYPKLLSNTSINELFSAGGLLSDISTGSEPLQPELTEVSSIGRTLGSSIESIDAGIQERQHLSEITAVLKAVEESQGSSTSAARPPDAPTGAFPVNQTTVMDQSNGRPYYAMYKGPGKLSDTSELAEAQQRRFTDVPDFSGTGMTISFWYRHVPCAVENCGVYLFVAYDDDRTYCWSLWLENSAIWYDNLFGVPQKYQYPRDFVDDKFELNGEEMWRHLAMVMDQTDDQVRYYVDGDLAWTGPWLSPVSGAHCNGANKRISFGHSEPGWTYGLTAEVYDVRMYVHPTTNPLQDADIAAIASSPTPELDSNAKCLPITSPEMRDGDWVDTYGHTCAWYASNKDKYPALCSFPEAAKNCPIACSSRQECFLRSEDPPVFFSWDRIRRIESLTTKGSICLGSDLYGTEASLVQQCRDWMKSENGGYNDPRMEAWLDSTGEAGGVRATGRMLNLTDCDQLEQAIDPHCSFNQSAVKEFTRHLHANGGDYTIAFWIKPLGVMSLHEEMGRFFPGLKFYSSLSPPEHPMTLAAWQNPNGEFRWYSSCDTGGRDIYENVEMKAASNDDWTFLAVSRTNSTFSSGGADYSVATNLGRNWEGSQMAQCFYDPESFFSALEVNYASLISPMMMVPQALPFARIQELYLANVKDMEVRDGPVVSKGAVVRENQIEIDKEDYSPRATLMAPPIVFQSRFLPTATCPVTYGTTFLQSQHNKVTNFVCAEPYECDDEVLTMPEMTMACPGEQQKNGSQFGLSPMEFLGTTGYADFLFSLTDNPFLFRDGDVSSTFNFLDSMTERVQIILVFFTPKTGVTSVLNVVGDFSGDSSTDVKVVLEHFEILEGTGLSGYLAVQSIVLISIAIMIVDIFLNVKHVIQEILAGDGVPISLCIKQVVDLGTATMVIVFIALRIPSKLDSADNAEQIVGGLNEIKWDNTQITLETKTQAFFEQVNDLLNLIGQETDLSRFCNILLFVSLLRVIQCTALHPRLALLTGTVVKALDDLWHALLLILLLMVCFACIASWRFGSTRADFGDLQQALLTQFMMMFGEFPENWTENGDLVLYTIFYFIIVFLLVQNFLLAIIVEAYMQVRNDNAEQETEMEFTSDVYTCFGAHYLAWVHGWPWPGRLGRIVDSWSCKLSVSFPELWATGLFRNQKAVTLFLKHYEKYDFLEVAEVSKYPPSRPGEEVVDQVERRISKLLGFRVPTLKEYAEHHIRKSKLWLKLQEHKITKDQTEPVKEGLKEGTQPLTAWGESGDEGPEDIPTVVPNEDGSFLVRTRLGSTAAPQFAKGGLQERQREFQESVMARLEAQERQLGRILKIFGDDGSASPLQKGFRGKSDGVSRNGSATNGTHGANGTNGTHGTTNGTSFGNGAAEERTSSIDGMLNDASFADIIPNAASS